MISGLRQAYDKHPKGVSCWESGVDPTWGKAGLKFEIPAGFSGCIIKTNTLKKLAEFDLPPKACDKVDDHWLGWAYNKLGAKVKKVDYTTPWWHSTKNIHDHPPWFELHIDTDRGLEAYRCGESLLKIN